MLSALYDREEGLLALVAHFATATALAQLAKTASWTRQAALDAADRRVRALIESERSVSRWRRSAYAGCGDVVREAYHIECAAAYAQERKQFGKPIAANQSLAFKLADMATECVSAEEGPAAAAAAASAATTTAPWPPPPLGGGAVHV